MKVVKECRDECDSKMSKIDGKELWAHLSKFPVYDDLKDLYMKCIPQINLFEDKIQVLRDDI